jgi:hypothetical protein
VTNGVTDREWARALELLRNDELSAAKPAYAYCTALACVAAEHCGHSAITVAEFGVGWGHGLRELARVGAVLSAMTGVDVSVVGFDRNGGLPPVTDRRDHPEVWHEGQFANQDLAGLRDELSGAGRLIVGDLSETVSGFVNGLTAECPLGAVMLDVDLYSSARDALRVFDGPPEAYLPSVPMYVDDIDALLTMNGRCGEALAIAEFNQRREERFVEAKRVRVGWAPRRWHYKIFACHVLDHPARSDKPPPRALEIHVDQY